MAIPTFVQKSRINQVIYQIRDGQLLISERALLGKFQDRTIDLRSLNPDYQPGVTRSHRALAISLLLAAVCSVLTWLGLRQTTLPEGAMFYLIQWPAIGAVVFFVSAVHWTRRIEYYRFDDRNGRPAVLFIRERDQAEECAAFITTLVAQIEAAVSGVSSSTAAPVLRELGAHRYRERPADADLGLWKASIVCGALAAGLPWLPNIQHHFGGLLTIFVILFCGGGASLSVFAFVNKETGRWWSAIGLLLSLVPPFFYF